MCIASIAEATLPTLFQPLVGGLSQVVVEDAAAPGNQSARAVRLRD